MCVCIGGAGPTAVYIHTHTYINTYIYIYTKIHIHTMYIYNTYICIYICKKVAQGPLLYSMVLLLGVVCGWRTSMHGVIAITQMAAGDGVRVCVCVCVCV